MTTSAIADVTCLGVIEGDPTAGADNAATLKALIEADPDSTYYFPRGVYYFDEVRITADGIREVRLAGDTTHTFPDSPVQSQIRTGGSNFLVRDNAATSQIRFTVTGLSLYSTGQQGRAFSSVDTTETRFTFTNVLVQEFDYGFFAPHYATGCKGRDIAFRRNRYGIYVELASNVTTIDGLSINHNRVGVHLSGYQAVIRNVHYGVGYPCADAAMFPYNAGIETAFAAIDTFYVEAYGADVSQSRFFVIDFPGSSAGLVQIANANFPRSGDTVGAKHLVITNGLEPYGTRPFPLNRHIVTIDNSDVAGLNIHTDGTSLVRGVSVNGDNYFKNSAVAVFDKYELFINAPAVTQGAVHGTAGLTLHTINIAAADVEDFNLFVNGGDTSSSGQLIAGGHPRVLNRGRYAVQYEVQGAVATSGTYTLGIRYRDMSGVTRIRRVKTVAVAGGYLVDSGVFEFDSNGQFPLSLGFVAGGAVPAAEDYPNLSLRMHIRQLNALNV